MALSNPDIGYGPRDVAAAGKIANRHPDVLALRDEIDAFYETDDGKAVLAATSRAAQEALPIRARERFVQLTGAYYRRRSQVIRQLLNDGVRAQ